MFTPKLVQRLFGFFVPMAVMIVINVMQPPFELNINTFALSICYVPSSRTIISFMPSLKPLKNISLSEIEDISVTVSMSLSNSFFCTSESFSCVLCTHKSDSRSCLAAFLHTLRQLYDEAVAFPL